MSTQSRFHPSARAGYRTGGPARCRQFGYGTFLAAVLALTAVAAGAAGQWSNIFVNGRQLSVAEAVVLQQRLGTAIAPGYYLYNGQNGCWANLTSGASGCLQASGSYSSPSGSGEVNPDGSWSHYDRDSHFSVGGSADGCLYAGDWSNC